TAGQQGATNQPLFMALLLALVGGVILNLTPGVFPVLSLNILRMTKHAGERRATVMSGMAYTVGVMASLLTLAGALLFFRAVGMQLGWGFQFQSPLFVSAMALLFFLIRLNLAGFFEVSIALPGNGGSLRAENPTVDSFLPGVLAVIVASPCTAPFMGGAIGLAVTLPAVQALLVFAALGCGIALPFLVISLVPAVAQVMPRP